MPEPSTFIVTKEKNIFSTLIRSRLTPSDSYLKRSNSSQNEARLGKRWLWERIITPYLNDKVTVFLFWVFDLSEQRAKIKPVTYVYMDLEPKSQIPKITKKTLTVR